MDDVWVVMACRKGSQEHFWAWGRPRRDAPGFEEIYYTQRDGVTAWSPSGDDLPILGEHLFTIVFPGQEAAPQADRFRPERDGSGLAPDPAWRPAPPTLEAAGADAGSPD